MASDSHVLTVPCLADMRGKPSKPAKVALVGSHADSAQCHRNLQGEFVAPQVHLLQVRECTTLFFP